MRIKIVLFFTSVLSILILLNSCIIINQSGKTAANDTSVKGNGSRNEEAGQSEEPDLEETDSTIDVVVEGTENEFSDLIKVFSPTPDQIINSPLLIEGEARGTWFFEASFPVKLLDAEGNVIAEHYAQTEEEWMTEDFISFTSQIEFNMPDSETGTLVLIKDNPSGLREYDAQIEIPVRFR